MKSILSIVALLGICAHCGADCRARVSYYRAPAVVYVPPVLQYQQPPYYVASYSGLTASTEAVLARRFDILGQKLDAFTQRLEQALQQGQANPQQATVHPGATYLGNSCVKCHDAQVAKAKGGGHTFFNLNQFIGTPEQQWAISKAIRTGTMPKGGPKASNEEYDVVLQFMEEASAQRAAKQPEKMPLAK